MYLLAPTCQVACFVVAISLQVSLILSHGPGDRQLFIASLCLVLVPHCLTNLGSLIWAYATVDWGKRRTEEGICVVLHILQVGLLWRYWRLVRLKDHAEMRSFAVLRLVQGSLQEAPFLVLTGSVMLSRGVGTALGVAAAATALLSLSLAYTCPMMTKPLNNRTTQSISTNGKRYALNKSLHFLSHLFLLSSRILAASLFVSAVGYWIFLTAGLHFFAVGCFVLGKVIQMRIAGERGSGYTVLMFQIYDTIDLCRSPRSAVIFLYVLFGVENSTMTFFWLSGVGSSLRNLAIALAVLCAFAMGSVMTVIREKCVPLISNLPKDNKKPEDKRRILSDKSPQKTQTISSGHVNIAIDCPDDFSLSQDIISASTPNRVNSAGVPGLLLSSPTSPVSMSARRGLSLGDTPSALQDSGYLSRVETPPLTETDIEGIACVVDMGPLMDMPLVDKVVGGETGKIARCKHHGSGSGGETCLECQVDVFFISGKSTCLQIIPDLARNSMTGSHVSQTFKRAPAIQTNDSMRSNTSTIDLIMDHTGNHSLTDRTCEQSQIIQAKDSGNSDTLSLPSISGTSWLPLENQDTPETDSGLSQTQVKSSPEQPVHPATPVNRAWADFSSSSSDSSRPCRRRRIRRLRSLPARPREAYTRDPREVYTRDPREAYTRDPREAYRSHKQAGQGSAGEESDSLTDSCSLTYCDICGRSESGVISETSSDSEWDGSSEDEQALTWPPSRRVLLASLPQESVDPSEHVSEWLRNFPELEPEELIRRESLQMAMKDEIPLSIKGLFPRPLETRYAGRGKNLFKGRRTPGGKGRSPKRILLRLCSLSGRKFKLPSSKNRQTIKSVSQGVSFATHGETNVGRESCV